MSVTHVFQLRVLALLVIWIVGCGDNRPSRQTPVLLEITPAEAVLAPGGAVALSALATYDDTRQADVTQSATWTADPPLRVEAGVVSVPVHAIITQPLTVTASLDGVTAQATIRVGAGERQLVGLRVEPVPLSLPAGVQRRLTALAVFSDTTTVDVSRDATWTTVHPTIATIAVEPTEVVLTSRAAGTTTLTASYLGQQATASIEVTAATLVSLAITPPGGTLAVGQGVPLTAVGTFSDGSTQELTGQATWTTSDETLATVNGGYATAVRPGTVTLYAEVGAQRASATFTVGDAILTGLEIGPPGNLTLAIGHTLQLSATAIYSDNHTADVTTQVAWRSGAMAMASVDAQGLVTALAVGDVEVFAAFGGQEIHTHVLVTSASLERIAVEPGTATLAKGTSVALVATGHFSDGSSRDITNEATWTSGAPALASVATRAPNTGIVTALAVGATDIQASYGTIVGTAHITISAATLTRVEVTPSNTTVAKGLTQQYHATGTYSDGSTQDLTGQATWSTARTTIATISNAGNKGLLTAIGVGQTRINARVGNITGSTAITVSAAELVHIIVSPAAATNPRGTGRYFGALGQYSDGSVADITNQVTFASSDTRIVYISNASGTKGLAIALELGTVTITATLGNRSGAARLNVVAARLVSIQVTPAAATLPRGRIQAYAATGVFSDGTTQDLTNLVTWSTSNATVASVSNADGTRGQLTALAQGTSTVAATYSNLSGSTTVTVTAAVLQAVAITPANLELAKGLTQQLTATGTYSDGSTQDVTQAVTWASAVPSVATVSNAGGSRGVVEAVAPGATEVTATLGSVSAQTTLTVTSARLQAIQLTPSAPEVAAGYTTQLTAIGVFSDGSNQDLTSQAAWTSSAPATATVENGATGGLVYGVAEGQATVQAQVDGITGSTTVIISAADLLSIALTPAQKTVAKGVSVGYVATGTFSDGRTLDISTAVTWTSSNDNIASVSNAAGSQGLAQTLAVGATVIRAEQAGIFGETTLAVTAATLASITITPSNSAGPLGIARQFVATGNYTDGTTEDLTTQATWATTTPALLSVSNAAGSQGLAQTLATGSSVVTATRNGIRGVTRYTITSAVLNSIEVRPATPTLAKGTSLQLTAVGNFSDGSAQDLTSQVTWDSSANTVAAVSNAAGSKGLLTALDLGSATVSATFGSISGATKATVTAATLVSIAITPAAPGMLAGEQLQLTATGTFSDGSTQDLTAQTTWATSNAAVATVSNAAGHEGMLDAHAQGSATIIALHGTLSASTTVTVTAP